MATPERIGVLAVMLESAALHGDHGDRIARSVELDARAAVAELIAAASQVYRSDNMTADWPRLGAALARVQGGAL